MRQLWETIRRSARDPDRIPEFPPKKWFGSKNKEFVEQRKCALEIFYNTLLESPDQNVYNHIMTYFKALTKNKEAKDAIASIEEYVAGGGRPEQTSNKQQSPTMNTAAHEEEVKAQPTKKPVSTKNEKDYAESCNKIVENFNKNLIDLGFGNDGEAIQDLMNKGQTYKKHFEDTGINKKFKYTTKLLDLPKGDDDNLLLLEDDADDGQNEKVNDNLEDVLNAKHELYVC
jgi:hypothetical protein